MVDTVDVPRRPKRQELAAALGISRQMVHKLEQQGMSTESVDAARAWRANNLREHMTKGYRLSITDPAPSPGIAELAALEALWPVARAALEADRFELVEAAMRAALRAVPLTAREHVVLNVEVWNRLIGPTLAAIRPDEPTLSGAAEAAASPLGDAEIDSMGRFWYSVAAGEPIDWTQFK